MNEESKFLPSREVDRLFRDLMVYRQEFNKFVLNNEDLDRALLELGERKEFRRLVLAASDLMWNEVSVMDKLIALSFFDRERVIKAISDSMDADIVED